MRMNCALKITEIHANLELGLSGRMDLRVTVEIHPLNKHTSTPLKAVVAIPNTVIPTKLSELVQSKMEESFEDTP